MNDFNIRMFNPQPEPPARKGLTMPTMPAPAAHGAYLTPGVYVEEVSFRRS